jgi:hypothetical protein
MAEPRRLLTAVPGVLLQLVGGLAIAFAVGRGVYYPFWAAHATRTELARSWGGPSPVGATLAHWAVGVLVLAVGWLLLRLGHRWRHWTPRN